MPTDYLYFDSIRFYYETGEMLGCRPEYIYNIYIKYDRLCSWADWLEFDPGVILTELFISQLI